MDDPIGERIWANKGEWETPLAAYIAFRVGFEVHTYIYIYVVSILLGEWRVVDMGESQNGSLIRTLIELLRILRAKWAQKKCLSSCNSALVSVVIVHNNDK